MTQYGDNKCLDCEHNRKCYMRSIRAHECGVEFVCKKEEDKKIEKLPRDELYLTERQQANIIDKINEIIEVINERTL